MSVRTEKQRGVWSPSHAQRMWYATWYEYQYRQAECWHMSLPCTYTAQNNCSCIVPAGLPLGGELALVERHHHGVVAREWLVELALHVPVGADGLSYVAGAPELGVQLDRLEVVDVLAATATLRPAENQQQQGSQCVPRCRRT